jgi:hypothetical protein
MKVPFRQQASDCDCVPTTFINALSYLFDRKDIPPFVVQRVYRDCLDNESSTLPGRGTSTRAIQDLGLWLSHYKEKRYKKFAVVSKFICGDQVHLRKNSKIIRCINANGAALMCVHSGQNNWHYILGFRHDGEWLHCYDPAPRSKKFVKNDAVQFVASTGQQEPNLLIRCDWLNKKYKKTKNSDERKYIFGCKNDRECLLLNRIHV